MCVCYLCPRDGPKRIGGSQDRLVVHDRLWGHHGNAPHLMTHLRRELDGGQVRSKQKPNQIKSGLIPAENEWKLSEIRRLFTIPYTGTWGVVIGKATGAGACAEQQEHNRLFVAELQSDLKLKVDCKHNPDTVGLVTTLLPEDWNVVTFLNICSWEATTGGATLNTDEWRRQPVITTKGWNNNAKAKQNNSTLSSDDSCLTQYKQSGNESATNKD